MSEQNTTDISQHFYRASAADFMKIPGSPVAYWTSNNFINLMLDAGSLSDRAVKGLDTNGNIELFLKRWHEINITKSSLRDLKHSDNTQWFPIAKGGEFRKWYGNNDFVINYQNDGEALRKNKANLRSKDKYFLEGATWTVVSSAGFSVRYLPAGFTFDQGGSGIFTYEKDKYSIWQILSSLNSSVVSNIASMLCPTLNFTTGDVRKFPIWNRHETSEISKKLVSGHKNDWDVYETSWDFNSLSLLASNIKQPTLNTSYTNLRAQGLADTQEMQRLEEENNRIFIDAYGLQDELTPDVPLKEITLTCNPHYRYSGDLTEQQREDRLQSDTIVELMSYAIGCMMGRYSLDREGLVYAHAGNQGFAELVNEGAYTTFAADDDAILPITEQEWFSDDVTNRVSEFVRTVYDEQHLEENLQFIADSLCLYAIKPKKGERALETIRRYLGTQFYKDHLKTYKRRPIYWLFSSGKHKAFECLVYLHRYHEGTLARMRTEYVIPLTARINARINRLNEEVEAASSTSERNQINRELKALQNQQAELATFDEQLRHHADQRISLDLDDGVKENYGKFGNLLAEKKSITGEK